MKELETTLRERTVETNNNLQKPAIINEDDSIGE